MVSFQDNSGQDIKIVHSKASVTGSVHIDAFPNYSASEAGHLGSIGLALDLT